MPFKTKYGTHYHMTQGCHGADIPCGTEGLSPCADCCGGAGHGDDGGGAPAVAGPGSPNVGTGEHGPTRERLEEVERWRRAATSAMFDPSFPKGGRRLSRHEKEEMLLASMEAKAEAELDAMMAAADSPDWDFDEMADDASPFGDGGRYSLYGSSDSFPDDGDWDAYYDTRASEAISEVGMAGMGDGMGMPADVQTDSMAERMAEANADGIRPEDWDDETRRLAEAAGLPDSSNGMPTVMMGQVGQLRVFATNHRSTHNPNDEYDHYGEWLYDVKAVHVVAPDGTNLTGDIQVAGNLRRSIERDEGQFMDRCRQEAEFLAGGYRSSMLQHERDQLVKAARERYEQTVVEPWKDEYATWRKQHEDEAREMAEQMRADRPEWRHRYIADDVEERLRKRFERRNPRPRDFVLYDQDRLAIEEEARRRTEEQLTAEGWDYDAEYEKAMAHVLSQRDPNGNRGVSPRMRENYEAAMGRLSRYPEAEGFIGMPLTWGATAGTPIRTPAEWRERLGRR